MGTRFRIDTDHDVVVAHGSGIVHASEIVECAHDQCDDPQFVASRNILWDLRDARLLVEYDDIKPLIKQLDELPTRSVPHRVAWLVSSDLTRMLTRLFERMSVDSPVEYRSFDSLENVREWLALPGDFEPSGNEG